MRGLGEILRGLRLLGMLVVGRCSLLLRFGLRFEGRLFGIGWRGMGMGAGGRARGKGKKERRGRIWMRDLRRGREKGRLGRLGKGRRARRLRLRSLMLKSRLMS